MTLIDERPVARARAAEAPECDVAIIGAGPYGLSAAAHLGAIDGLDVAHLRPADVLLGAQHARRHAPALAVGREQPVAPRRAASRSTTTATTRSRLRRAGPAGPVRRLRPLVPAPDRARPRRAAPSAAWRRTATGFVLELEDGEPMRARRVVVAAGIAPFAYRPPLFDTLRPGLVSHAVEHRDLGLFDGRRVIVIGGGQSALESAALLREAGAEVEVLVRERDIYWLTRRWQHRMPVRDERALRAGRRRPGRDQPPRRAARALAAAAARAPGPPGAPLDPSCRRRLAAPAPGGRPDPHARRGRRATRRPTGGSGSGCRDGARRPPTIVLLGTGYRVDVARYAFLSPRPRRADRPRRRLPAPAPRLRVAPRPACTSSARPRPGATAR